jgi:hypothetical protein
MSCSGLVAVGDSKSPRHKTRAVATCSPPGGAGTERRYGKTPHRILQRSIVVISYVVSKEEKAADSTNKCALPGFDFHVWEEPTAIEAARRGAELHRARTGVY